MHDDTAVERRGEPERPTVDPGLGAAGENDIGSAAEGGTELDGTAGQRPMAGVGPATVDAVRPDEVVQLVELEREPRSDLVGGPAFHLTGRLLELRLQLDDQPLYRATAPLVRIRSIAGPEDRRTAWSMTTTGRSRHGAGMSVPASTTRLRPSASGPASCSHDGIAPEAATRLDGSNWRIAGSALIDESPPSAPEATPPAVPAPAVPAAAVPAAEEPFLSAERCQHLRTSSAVGWVPPQSMHRRATPPA